MAGVAKEAIEGLRAKIAPHGAPSYVSGAGHCPVDRKESGGILRRDSTGKSGLVTNKGSAAGPLKVPISQACCLSPEIAGATSLSALLGFVILKVLAHGVEEESRTARRFVSYNGYSACFQGT